MQFKIFSYSFYLYLIILLHINYCVSASLSLNVPQTNGKLDVDFDFVSGEGSGSDVIGEISFENGAGTIDLNGKTYQSIAYAYQDWTSAGYYLYDIIGISEDSTDLAVFYIYTNLAGSSIEQIWYESLVTVMNYESASGNVTDTVDSSTIDVNIPALKTDVNPIDTGSIDINGDNIQVSSGQGWMNDGNNYTITVFNTVDCSACGGGGWYELHSIFSPSTSEACFGILYLEFSSTSSVVIDWSLCFDDLSDINTSFIADWSGSLSGSSKVPMYPLRKV